MFRAARRDCRRRIGRVADGRADGRPAFACRERASKAKGPWTAPRTPWGDPDIAGIFTTDDELGVPFERPEQFAGREFVTEEEFAQRLTQAQRQADADQEEFVAPRAGSRRRRRRQHRAAEPLAGARQAVAPHVGHRGPGRRADPVPERRSASAIDHGRQRANIGAPSVRWSGSAGSVRPLHHAGFPARHLSRRFTTTRRRSCRARATWRCATR